MRRTRSRALGAALAFSLAAAAIIHSGSSGAEPLAVMQLGKATASKPLFSFEEVLVPMRDGIHLQTVIMRPLGRAGELPILLRRTPYGIPGSAIGDLPPGFDELAADGYILVFQNLRGRFKSEGIFQVSTRVNLNDPDAIDEATDGYDTIDWLVKHVPKNNRKVGMIGISYSGLSAGMALLRPHPALKAVSVQAAPTDLFFPMTTFIASALCG